MLTQMRQVTRGFFAMLLLGLIALAMAIWGVSDVFTPIQSNEVAHGRGLSIKEAEYARAFDSEFKAAQNQAQAQGGRLPTKQEAIEANFHMQVLDRLITQKVFDRLAGKIGIDTANATIEAEVRANPAFQNQVTATFDANTYRQMLARNGYTREQYEEGLRQDMTRMQLARAIAVGVRPPPSFAEMVFAFETERRTVAVAAIAPDRVPAPPAPTDADLEAFYKSASNAFEQPEMRAVTIVHAEASMFEPRVEVAETKIRELFEFRKASLSTPERRSFVVLTAPDQAKAQQAAAKLAAGETPDSVAGALGMQIVAYANKTKADVPDKRVADAAYALAAGKSSPPIEGVAWSVVRLDSITPGVTPNFEEAHGLLRAELARDEAQTLMDDAVEKFEDARASGATLEDAARQSNLELVKTQLFDARGLNEQNAPEPSVLDQPELLKAAFAASEGDPSDWVSTEEGGSFLVRLDTLRPKGAPPLAKIREEVANAWRFRRIADAMNKIAADVQKAVSGGASFSDVVRAQRLQIVAQPQEIDRRSAQQGPMAPLAPAIFAAKEGEVVSGVGGPGNKFLLLAHITQISRDDPATNPQRIGQIRTMLAQGLANDVIESAQRGARQAARVRLNQNLIDRTVGKTQETDTGT